MRGSPNACSERAWSCASAFDGYRKSARARESRERISSVGSWNASDFPDAVPVVMIVVCSQADSSASAWWLHSESMPRRSSAAQHVAMQRRRQGDLLREALVLHRLAHEPLVVAAARQQRVPGLDVADDGHTSDPTSRDSCR